MSVLKKKLPDAKDYIAWMSNIDFKGLSSMSVKTTCSARMRTPLINAVKHGEEMTSPKVKGQEPQEYGINLKSCAVDGIFPKYVFLDLENKRLRKCE